jgi:hypothetical protein
MPKYRIKYVYERWYNLDIEADSEEQALDKFHSSDFKGEGRLVGGELQDSTVVEEL